MHKYGYRRSPAGSKGSHALHDLPRIRSASAALPALVDNRNLVVEVLDQGQLGSCELNGCANAVRGEMVRKQADALVTSSGISFADAIVTVKQGPPALPDRKLLYWAAQAYDGDQGQGDTGTCTSSVASAACQYGYMEEGFWPYNDDPRQMDPGTALEAYKRLAYDQRLAATARVDSDSMSVTEALSAVKAALAAGYLLPIAFPVDQAFEDLRAGQIWPGPTGQELGGHCTLLVGYGPANKLCSRATTSADALLILNSWGTSYCDGGYFLMTLSALAARYDVWCFSQAPANYSGTV